MDKAGCTGSWTSGSTFHLSRYTNRTPSRSSTTGAKATFSLTGRTLALVSRLGPTNGKATIYVDGTRVASIDL